MRTQPGRWIRRPADPSRYCYCYRPGEAGWGDTPLLAEMTPHPLTEHLPDEETVR